MAKSNQFSRQPFERLPATGSGQAGQAIREQEAAYTFLIALGDSSNDAIYSSCRMIHE
jgi:hypothetical protein